MCLMFTQAVQSAMIARFAGNFLGLNVFSHIIFASTSEYSTLLYPVSSPLEWPYGVEFFINSKAT